MPNDVTVYLCVLAYLSTQNFLQYSKIINFYWDFVSFVRQIPTEATSRTLTINDKTENKLEETLSRRIEIVFIYPVYVIDLLEFI